MPENNTTQKESLISEIKRLASIDKVGYELLRADTAKNFQIRETKLDEFVYEERKKTEEEKSETVLFSRIEPWPEAINLFELLEEIVMILNKYISFNSKHEARAIALWVIHTYCIEAAYISPILFVTSAEMRSGKSTLLSILQKIVFKCVPASSTSPSVIYRIIPKYHPTLIFDEADTYLTDKNEDLRGILNAGHSRDTSGVLRTNPETLEVERFDAFGAKCLAAIKSLPGTVEDRSIIIKMRRMVKGQKKAKMRMINSQLREEFLVIQRKCAKFAGDNIEQLKNSNSPLPDKLNDRAADNWHPLFQIAKLANPEWLNHVNDAALSLSGFEQENKSIGIELLEDINNIFDGKYQHVTDIRTTDLIEALCQDDESPWATYNKNRKDTKITPRQLATLLKSYGIGSKNIARGADRPKGYHKNDFQDAFSRYIHAETPDLSATAATAAPPNNHGAYSENENINSSATSRSIRYQNEMSSDSKIAGAAVAERSGSERIKSDSKKLLETPSNLARAAVADKNADLGGRDYIDV